MAPSQAAVGPRLFPFLVATGLIVVGAALLREALFGHIAHEGGFELDWRAVGLVSAGLVVQMLLLESLGWIVAATCCSWRPPWPSAAAGSARRGDRGRPDRPRLRDVQLRPRPVPTGTLIERLLPAEQEEAQEPGTWKPSPPSATASPWRHPYNLFWSALGVTVGTAVGVLPGIGPALTVALLLPVTYNLEPDLGLHHVRRHLLRCDVRRLDHRHPAQHAGRVGSIVTAIDGHEMARQGRGAQALATAAIGSFVAGTIATVGLTFVAPLLVKLALLFGPAEYFALMVLALVTVTAVLGDSLPRGLASLFFGLALGLVGIDLQTGQARFTLGIPEMLDGIDTVVVAVGPVRDRRDALRRRAPPLRDRGDLRDQGLDVDEQGGLGALVEALAARHRVRLPDRRPAGRRQRDPDLPLLPDREEADPAPRGVRPRRDRGGGRAEAANNAAAAGVLAPLLSLGLPTSATAAIMLAAFQQYGLQPGPLLFESNPELVWGMIASLYIGNVLLVLNLPMAPVWVKLLKIPRPWLYGGILVFATLGAYTLNNNVVDLVILWIIGLIGFSMRVLDVPVAPCVVGLILGPLAEQQFRRALSISQGDLSVFFTHPISLGILLIAVLLVLVPIFLRRPAAARRPAGRDPGRVGLTRRRRAAPAAATDDRESRPDAGVSRRPPGG